MFDLKSDHNTKKRLENQICVSYQTLVKKKL